ncbi:TetR/AcrR family transcriptional regulator [Cytobacillus praedii]|uniref:TetR/AcrR family transcriptional regulator n=1 Tax=Cytobacillus praedii TaxID=1742358 RepID=A0A4R1AVK0_9BACI|nr:TetR/AcrR family transcriptional regulator [Cytobacillus praedii]MED3551628.1 TetR/AcrR family transcriptional regulator [Cytobacillus praedii]TCJ04347.1 TetR/AcrR family transcriptional regulator [Cytobacillus praedii]
MSERDEGQLVGTFPSIPKQIRAQQKRLALLESGRSLFIKKGYEQTTAKDIASYAGVATGTFYRYFSDKRQLLLALLEDKMEKLMPPVPNWMHRNPEQLLASLLENYNNSLEAIGIHRVLPELLPKDPELSEVMLEARKSLHARIYKGLQSAKDEGLTWKDLDLDIVAWTIILMVENSPEKAEQSGSPLEYDEMAKVICRLVFPPQIMEKLCVSKAESKR